MIYLMPYPALLKRISVTALIGITLLVSACGGSSSPNTADNTTDNTTNDNTSGAESPAVASTQRISAATSPIIEAADSPEIVFNDAGDAIAVWQSYAGIVSATLRQEKRLFYSHYTAATNSWSVEAELALKASDPVVASNGIGFMLGYIKDNQAVAVTFDNNVGLATPVVIGSLAEFSGFIHNLTIAANSSGYAASWSGGEASTATKLYANVYQNDAWASASSAHVFTSTDFALDHHLVASSSGYAIVWFQAATYSGVSGNLMESRFAAGVWTTARLFASQGSSPKVAASSAGYAVSWVHNIDSKNRDLYVSLYNGTSWSTDHLLESLTGVVNEQDITSNGTGYAVTWIQSAGTSLSLYASVYDGTSWSAASLLEQKDEYVRSNIRIASNGSSYTVSWRQDDANGVIDLYSNEFIVDTWQGATLIESLSGDVAQPRIVRDLSRYSLAWLQNNGEHSTVYVSRQSGSEWLAATDLNQLQHMGTVLNGIRYASNQNGQLLAIWKQFNDGDKNLYARLFDGTKWLPSFEVASNGSDLYEVASNGTDFMLVFVQASKLKAATYNQTQGMGAVVDLSTRPPDANGIDITSNGTGYAVAWSQATFANPLTSLYVNRYDGNSWLGEVLVENMTGLTFSPQIASDGTGYAVTWRHSNQLNGPSYSYIYANVFNGVSWAGEHRLENLSNYGMYPRIAGSSTGYAVIWLQTDLGNSYPGIQDVYTNLFDGTNWGTESLAEQLDAVAYRPDIVSNGNGYAAQWLQYDAGSYNLRVNRYEGSAWKGIENVKQFPNTLVNIEIASNGAGYALAWSMLADVTEARYEIGATVYAAGWGLNTPIATNQTAKSRLSLHLASMGNSYSLGWNDIDLTDSEPVINAYSYTGLVKK